MLCRIVDVRLLDLDKILLQITKYEVNIYEYMIRLTPMTYAELHVLCIPMPCDMCIV